MTFRRKSKSKTSVRVSGSRFSSVSTVLPLSAGMLIDGTEFGGDCVPESVKSVTAPWPSWPSDACGRSFIDSKALDVVGLRSIQVSQLMVVLEKGKSEVELLGDVSIGRVLSLSW